jgi:transposase-like protein
MATRKQFTMNEAERRRRHFSDNFKKSKVQELELGRLTISELKRQYEVSSTTIYRWIANFGTMKNKPERIIVETDSDTKELLLLKQKIADLERTVGQKQVLIDFYDKLIDIAEIEYKVDIKKKFGTKP